MTPAASPDERSQLHGLNTLTLSALFGVSLAVIAAGYLLDIGAVRLAGVLGAVFLGAGTAPLQLSARASLAMRLGVAGVVGLSVLTLLGSLMALVPVWHPVLAGLLIGGAAAGVHVQACRRTLRAVRGPAFSYWVGRAWRMSADASMACTVGGTALWIWAVATVGHVVPGVGGFLPDISWTWFVGLVLVLGGIVLARGKSEAHAMIALVSLVAALTLTPAVAYGTPRAQAAAKHVDLVQLLLHAHQLDAGSGIYEAYSGFFSGIAWVCALAGTPASLGFAAYWPFVVGLLGVAELRFFFGRLTGSRYRVWAAMTLTVLVNAIGADYFSPQSAGFVMAVGIYALAVGHEWPSLDERMRIALLVLAGCALAVTHELSPYIAGGVLVVLVLFRVARPWYVPLTCLVPALFWALFNWREVSHYVSFASIGRLSNFSPPKTVASPGLQRVAIVGQSSHALLLGLLVLITLTGVGFARTMRRAPGHRRAMWGFMISAGVGLILIAINPYDNEGIFRAALFGIPWLAAVSMAAIPSHPPRWVSATFGAVAVGLLGTFLVAAFGLDNAYVIRSADFQALHVYQARASAGSYLLNLGYGPLPDSVTFPQPLHELAWTAVVPRASVAAGRPDAADVRALSRRYIGYAAADGGSPRVLYAIWSPACAAYSVDFGLETQGHAQKWRRLLIASPHWRVVFHRDGTYLFRVVLPPLPHAPHLHVAPSL